MRPLVMRAASAMGHHHVAAAAAMAQLVELRARLGALLADRGPSSAAMASAQGPPQATAGPPAQEVSHAAAQPRILARRGGPPSKDPGASTDPGSLEPAADADWDAGRVADKGFDRVPAPPGPALPARLADDVREALRVAARALAALGEPDDVEGLRVHSARVFAPLPGLLTGCGLACKSHSQVLTDHRTIERVLWSGLLRVICAWAYGKICAWAYGRLCASQYRCMLA